MLGPTFSQCLKAYDPFSLCVTEQLNSEHFATTNSVLLFIIPNPSTGLSMDSLVKFCQKSALKHLFAPAELSELVDK